MPENKTLGPCYLAQGQLHATIKGAGHFLQEHSPAELVQLTIDFIRDKPQ
jgi:pimeloyl-ACP methyl ester carboxylesterase